MEEWLKNKTGVIAYMVLSKNNTASGNNEDCKLWVVLLGTTPLKCSPHLALKFFKVVWLKEVPAQKPGLVSGVHSQFAQR